jgi:hypothetical protein
MAIDFTGAAALIRTTLQQWGLEALESHVMGYIQAGDTADVAVMKLRETNEYKTRFRANESRRLAGLAPLSEAEYISTEVSYRQVMRSYGLPEGFYDSYDDFANFIEHDVSPQEMRDRVVLASERYIFAPEEDKQQFSRFGLTPSQAIATILDPLRAEPLIRQTVTAAALAAEAARAFGNPEKLTTDRAMELSKLGVTETDARRGFGQLQATQENDLLLGRMAGEDVSVKATEDEALLGYRSTSLDRARNQAREDFRGSYTATETGLGRRTTGGQY